MSYLGFHLVFNLPVLCLLLWVTRQRIRPAHWKCIAGICGIVFLVTTPWDNWAVHRGIWSFDSSRVTPITIKWRGIIWTLPAEEYAFFLIETVLVSLLTLLFLPKTNPGKMPDNDRKISELTRTSSTNSVIKW